MILKFTLSSAIFDVDWTLQKARVQTQTAGCPFGLENLVRLVVLKFFGLKTPHVFLKIIEDPKNLLFMWVILSIFTKLELKLGKTYNLLKK